MLTKPHGPVKRLWMPFTSTQRKHTEWKCISLFFSNICAPGLRWFKRLRTGYGRFQQRKAFEIRLWFSAKAEAGVCSIKPCGYLSLIDGDAHVGLLLHGPVYCIQQDQSKFLNQLMNSKQWSQNSNQAMIYATGNHSAHPCTGDYWPVPMMVAFKSNLIQLFLSGCFVWCAWGSSSCIRLRWLSWSEKTPNSFISSSCTIETNSCHHGNFSRPSWLYFCSLLVTTAGTLLVNYYCSLGPGWGKSQKQRKVEKLRLHFADSGICCLWTLDTIGRERIWKSSLMPILPPSLPISL